MIWGRKLLKRALNPDLCKKNEEEEGFKPLTPQKLNVLLRKYFYFKIYKTQKEIIIFLL